MTDLRQLNDVTIKDAYPLKNIQENPKVEGCKNLHFNRCLRGISHHTDRRGEQGLYSFYLSFRHISLYKDDFWPVKHRKCLQPDVGPGPGALTCRVLVIIFRRHPGVLHGHLGPLEASEEYRGGSYEGRDQDST